MICICRTIKPRDVEIKGNLWTCTQLSPFRPPHSQDKVLPLKVIIIQKVNLKAADNVSGDVSGDVFSQYLQYHQVVHQNTMRCTFLVIKMFNRHILPIDCNMSKREELLDIFGSVIVECSFP